ncbi:DUF2269 domain-containing protein [Kitasatospora sp. NBC_00458]|uniref:DUF2269 domain-containing protein n=1 Tax=Kitasatospora sp. NBC_00458 TaxID=2903568 RepID=UPI002E19C799
MPTPPGPPAADTPAPPARATAASTETPGPPADRAGRFRLPRHARRIWLIAHVALSVGWLGLTAGVLALGIAGRFSDDPETVKAAYLAQQIFADWLLIPVSLLSLLTGVVLSLGTSWGFHRYRWVVTKFWLTLAATLASIFALRAFIHDAAGQVAAGTVPPDGRAPHVLVIAPSVALTIYLTATILSVVKPWGMTRRGTRLAAAARAGRTRPSGGGSPTGTAAKPATTPSAKSTGTGTATGATVETAADTTPDTDTAAAQRPGR